MKLLNLIIVLSPDEKSVLMCHRSTDPYKGLFNFVGGKIEEGEDFLSSAYRELEEETNITKKDIELDPFVDFVWHPLDMEMKVYIGKLQHDVTLIDEAHKLYWIDVHEDFFDTSRFAGEGNIAHMMAFYFDLKEQLFK